MDTLDSSSSPSPNNPRKRDADQGEQMNEERERQKKPRVEKDDDLRHGIHSARIISHERDALIDFLQSKYPGLLSTNPALLALVPSDPSRSETLDKGGETWAPLLSSENNTSETHLHKSLNTTTFSTIKKTSTCPLNPHCNSSPTGNTLTVSSTSISQHGKDTINSSTASTIIRSTTSSTLADQVIPQSRSIPFVIRNQPRSRIHEKLFGSTSTPPPDVTERIKLVKKIALGGHSDVWLGTLQTDVGEIQVAIKELRVRQHQSSMPHDERLRKRFHREVLLWSQLKHPNVVPLLGSSVSSDCLPRLVSPWYSNGNVIEYLRLNPEANRAQLLHDVAQGLHYLHLLSLVHGDIKGDKVLVNADGVASLCDFGLAKFIDDALHITGFTTTTQGLGGTVRFLCPESLDDKPKTRSTDIWAFGCLTIQIMTDKVPYAHVATTSAVQMAIVRGDPPLPVDQTPSSHVGQSVGFWGMIRRCWDIDPSRRPTISELLGYIRGIMSKNRLTVDTRDGTVLMPVMLDRTVALTASPQAISTPLNRDRSDSSLWRCPEESRNLPITRHFPCRLRRRCRPLEAPRSDSVSSPF